MGGGGLSVDYGLPDDFRNRNAVQRACAVVFLRAHQLIDFTVYRWNPPGEVQRLTSDQMRCKVNRNFALQIARLHGR